MWSSGEPIALSVSQGAWASDSHPRFAGQTQASVTRQRAGLGCEGPGFWNLNELPVLQPGRPPESRIPRAEVPELCQEFGWVLSSEICLHNWLLSGGWTMAGLPLCPGECDVLVPKSKPGHCSPHSPPPSCIEPSVSQKTPLPLNTPSPGLSGLPVPAAWAHPFSPRDDADLRQAQTEVPDRPLPRWGLNAAERPSVFPSVKWK